jgi:tetratricopeptide (TPR) repeat protein
MLSYRLNGMLWGAGPAGYHVVNLLLHVFNACLVVLVFRRLLRKAGWTERSVHWAELGGGLIFLIHPLQTESVSYIAGRSESLASMFLLLAYVVYLYNRRDAISWGRAIAVMALFAVAVKTKENTVSLAGVLLLTDLMWPRPFSVEGPRRNWRLYALMLPGVLVAATLILRMLATAQTAGFSVANYTWYQYAFTEARAIFAYVQLAIAPIGQALDHDFAPSHSITEHGALAAMTALAGVAVAAFRLRRRYPLACFGFFLFLLLLAPTSTVVPVDDALVERRMYLPLLGLILIGCEAARRWKPSGPAMLGALATIALVFGGLCQARNRLWSKPELLLAQAAQDARYNPRPLLNVAEAVMRRNRCDLAIPYLDRAERILPNSYFVHAIRGRALACLGRLEEGMTHLQLAARIRPCSQIHQWMGLLYGQMRRPAEAGVSLRRAVDLDPASAAARGSLALWHESTGDFEAAEREYATNLLLDPQDTSARTGLERVQRARALSTPPSL